MRRSHRERVLARKRKREFLQQSHVRDSELSARISDGMFRKRDAHDCGRTRCQVCHGEKVHGRKSFADRRADEIFAGELEQLGS